MGLGSCWDQSGSPSAVPGGTYRHPRLAAPRGTARRPWHSGGCPPAPSQTAPSAQPALSPSQIPHASSCSPRGQRWTCVPLSPTADPIPPGHATSLAPTPPCLHLQPVPHSCTPLWSPLWCSPRHHCAPPRLALHPHPTSHPTSSPRAALSSRTRGCLSLGQDQLQIPPTLGGSDPLRFRLRVRGACATQPGKAGGASTRSHAIPGKSCFSGLGSSTVD